MCVSFVLVFIVLWIQTSSLFITCAGMFEIIISFPLGLFVWGVLMDEPGVTYLMYNGIFIILGIGCDDIFVFIDAFRQSELQPPHISGSLETRFAWAYNRAASPCSPRQLLRRSRSRPAPCPKSGTSAALVWSMASWFCSTISRGKGYACAQFLKLIYANSTFASLAH